MSNENVSVLKDGLGLKYYADLNDAPVTYLLWQSNIKTKNHLMDFSNSSWQDFPEYSQYFGRALKLLKSMYGMTNSGNCFADDLTEWLIE